MTDLLAWLLAFIHENREVLQGIAAVCGICAVVFPVLYRLFRGQPDRGYKTIIAHVLLKVRMIFSKPAGGDEAPATPRPQPVPPNPLLQPQIEETTCEPHDTRRRPNSAGSAVGTDFISALAQTYVNIANRSTNERVPDDERIAEQPRVKEAFSKLGQERKRLERPIELFIPCLSVNPLTSICRSLMQEGRTYAGIQWPGGRQYTLASHRDIFPEAEGLMYQIPQRSVLSYKRVGQLLVGECALLVATLDALVNYPPASWKDTAADDPSANAASVIINDRAVRTALTNLVKWRVLKWSASGPFSEEMCVHIPIPKRHPVAPLLVRLLRTHIADILFSAEDGKYVLNNPRFSLWLENLKRFGIPHINFLEDFVAKFDTLLKGLMSEGE